MTWHLEKHQGIFEAFSRHFQGTFKAYPAFSLPDVKASKDAAGTACFVAAEVAQIWECRLDCPVNVMGLFEIL